MITREKQRSNQITNSLRHLTMYDRNNNMLALHRKQRTWSIEKVLEHLWKPNAKVAEFGCLDGSVAWELADMVKEVYAYDLPEVVHNCMYNGHEKKNLTYSGVDLDKVFPILLFGKYDLILAIDVIEHLHEDEFFLLRCMENLYQNGKIVISTPLEKEPGKIDQDPARQSHFREYERNALMNLLYRCKIKINKYHENDNMIHIIGEHY